MQSIGQKQDPRKVLEQTYDRQLDKLYTSTVRCPYCKNKIQKLQTVCSRCGLHKIQIAYASNKRAKAMMKNDEAGKIIKMRRRPNDVPMWQLACRLIIGIFGVHNFYTGRRIRGWIMLGCMILFIIEATFIFPPGKAVPVDGGGIEWVGMHPWRSNNVFLMGTLLPFDFLGVIPMILWLSDSLGIIFGWYKYPVRLGEVNDAGKIWAK